MTLQNLQKQALQLSTSERWQLVQTLLESLQQETRQPLLLRRRYANGEFKIQNDARGLANAALTKFKINNPHK